MRGLGAIFLLFIWSCAPVTSSQQVTDMEEVYQEREYQISLLRKSPLRMNPEVNENWYFVALDMNRANGRFCSGSFQISIKGRTYCNVEVVVNNGDRPAYTDGRKIYFSQKMIDNFQNLEEFALVYSHELAHLILTHVNKKFLNRFSAAMFGAVIDSLVSADYWADYAGNKGELAYSKEFESEADYVGLYFAARAGVDLDKAISFFRTLAILDPKRIHSNYSETHPSTVERFLAMEKTIDEIHRKIATNQPLIPNGM